MAEELEQLNTDSGEQQGQTGGQSSDNPQEETQESSDQPEKGPVPYNRFHEVNSERNHYKERAEAYEQRIQKLRQQVNEDSGDIGERQPATNEGAGREMDFDQIVKTANSWNDVADRIADYSLDKQQRIQEQKEQAAKEAMQAEVEELHDLGLVENEEQETEVFDFAVKKSKELGRDIDLVTAANWMNDRGQAESEGEENALRKGEAGKVQSSKKSSGNVEGGEKQSYDQFKGANLGDIIEQAKE